MKFKKKLKNIKNVEFYFYKKKVNSSQKVDENNIIQTNMGFAQMCYGPAQKGCETVDQLKYYKDNWKIGAHGDVLDNTESFSKEIAWNGGTKEQPHYLDGSNFWGGMSGTKDSKGTIKMSVEDAKKWVADMCSNKFAGTIVWFVSPGDDSSCPRYNGWALYNADLAGWNHVQAATRCTAPEEVNLSANHKCANLL
jgi:hypothetical protein